MTLDFLNDVVNAAESTQNYVIIALNIETIGKLINRNQVSSLTGSALRTNVESLSKPRDVIKRSQNLAW